MADSAAIAALFDRINQELGGLDVLINNAATQNLEEITPPQRGIERLVPELHFLLVVGSHSSSHSFLAASSMASTMRL